MVSINFNTTVRIACCLMMLTLPLLFVSSAEAFEYPWRDHAEPFSFLFGNHFDSHQQTRLLNNGNLYGYLYITFTGEEVGGIGVAEHCENSTPAEDCVVGWIMRGKPGEANFVYHDGDHPIWLVFGRDEIPQPGAYGHFHWLGEPQSAGDLTEDDNPYAGYFLQLRAVKRFYFRHADEDILVVPGLDIATHINIVSSFPAIE